MRIARAVRAAVGRLFAFALVGLIAVIATVITLIPSGASGAATAAIAGPSPTATSTAPHLPIKVNLLGLVGVSVDVPLTLNGLLNRAPTGTTTPPPSSPPP